MTGLSYKSYFAPATAEIPPLPPANTGHTLSWPTSTADEQLLRAYTTPFWVLDVTTGEPFEGNEQFLTFAHTAWSKKLNCVLVAKDGRWQIHLQTHHLTYWDLPTIPTDQPYTQDELEATAARFHCVRLIGDGLKDWHIFQGSHNPVQSYLSLATDHYLLFFTKRTDGFLYKKWELYEGIQLSGGLLHQGLVLANEGFGINDSTPVKIVAETGEIVNRDPCVSWKLQTFSR